jgi:hypothetical protein
MRFTVPYEYEVGNACDNALSLKFSPFTGICEHAVRDVEQTQARFGYFVPDFHNRVLLNFTFGLFHAQR